MSLIHTCQLCGANSSTTLVELQRHARNWPHAPRNGLRGLSPDPGAKCVRPRIGRVIMNP